MNRKYLMASSDTVEIDRVKMLCTSPIVSGNINAAFGEVLVLRTTIAIALVKFRGGVTSRVCKTGAVKSMPICEVGKRHVMEAITTVVRERINRPYGAAFEDEVTVASIILKHPAIQLKVQFWEDRLSIPVVFNDTEDILEDLFRLRSLH